MVMRSLHLLLGELVDYAGLFPPATLEMREAVANYAKYMESAEAWMLGRFITPVARLEEFERAAKKYLSRPSGARRWRLSVLGGTDLTADLVAINEFNRRHALIDALEIKAGSTEEIERIQRAARASSQELAVYIEIPFTSDPPVLIAAIGAHGARAKARTGGLVPEAFPSATEIARFIGACASEHVPFKATAGLHHPLRSIHRLTYEDESVSGLMHGFLNVFLTAAWIKVGMSEAQAVALLEEKDASALQFDEEGVTWRDRRLTNEQISSARRELAIAFGSCSFAEPVEDLRAHGWL
jgi:hypothetical protein